MLVDPISRVIEQSVPEQISEVTAGLREMAGALEEVHKANKVLEFRPRGSKELRELLDMMKQVTEVESRLSKITVDLSNAMSKYRDIADSTATVKARLVTLDSDEAKANMANKVALEEKQRALKSEQQALDENYQARQKANDLKKAQQALDEIEINKLHESQLALKDNVKELMAFAKEREKIALSAAKKTSDAGMREQLLQEAAAAHEFIDQLKILQVELKKGQQELNKQGKQAEYLKSAYNKLNAEHSELYKTARDVGAIFGIESEQFKKAAAAANEPLKKLEQIDQALGNYRRNVGNYASGVSGISGAIARLTQELPAAANGIQTLLLGLSNNWQMLFDEISRFKTINADLVAQGKPTQSLFKAITSSIFSFQTLLSVGITLLTVYGAKLFELFTNTSNAGKAQNNFEEALKAANQQIAAEIGQLTTAQAVLTSATATREQQSLVLAGIVEKYPELLSGLDLEANGHEAVNQKIQEQIELLQQRAEQQAASNAITKATEDLTTAQSKLNEEMGFFEKFWAARPWGAKPYEELNQSAQEAITKQWELYQAGVISKDQYNVMYRRILDVADAQDVLTTSVERYLSPEQENIEKTQQLIDEKTKLLAKIREEKERIGDLTGVRQEQIEFLEQEIDRLQSLRQGYLDAADAKAKFDNRKEAPAKQTFAEIDLEDAENRLKIAKRGSKEALQAAKDAANARYNVELERIKKQSSLYKDDANKSLWILQETARARANLIQEINNAEESYARKNKTRQKNPVDTTNVEIKAQERYNKALADLEKQRSETEMAYNKAIYEDETKTLAERLDAYDAYVNELLRIQGIEHNQKLASIQVELDKIAEIEAKSADKRTAQEQKLLLEKSAILIEQQAEEEKHALLRQETLAASQKEIANIERSTGQVRLREIQQQIQATRTIWAQWEADRLKILEESYKKDEISSKEYQRQKGEIQRQANEQMNAALVGWLNKQSELIEKSDLPDEVKGLIKAALDQAKAEYSKSAGAEKKGPTLMQLLGFGNKSPEELQRDIARQIEQLYDSIYSVIEARRNAYYQNEFNQLDQQKQQLEDAANKEKAAIENSILSQQEKDKKLKELEDQKLVREKQLDQRRKALQREQAVRAKQDAIFQASINAGIAIAKALSNMGNGPAAVPLAIASAALIAAQTAANIAMISSRPIPEYWQGTPPGGHPGGLAKVSERGPELGILPNGTQFITPPTTTVLDLPKGTEIIPHDDLVAAANDATNNEIKYYQRETGSNDGKILINAFNEKMDHFTTKVVKTIQDKKETYINVNGTVDYRTKEGNTWTEYVGGII